MVEIWDMQGKLIKSLVNANQFEEAKEVIAEKCLEFIHPGDTMLINSKQNVRLPPTIAAEIDEFSP